MINVATLLHPEYGVNHHDISCVWWFNYHQRMYIKGSDKIWMYFKKTHSFKIWYGASSHNIIPQNAGLNIPSGYDWNIPIWIRLEYSKAPNSARGLFFGHNGMMLISIHNWTVVLIVVRPIGNKSKLLVNDVQSRWCGLKMKFSFTIGIVWFINICTLKLIGRCQMSNSSIYVVMSLPGYLLDGAKCPALAYVAICFPFLKKNSNEFHKTTIRIKKNLKRVLGKSFFK